MKRKLVRTAAVAAVALVSAVFASGAAADPVTGAAANGTYLALGDSVAFGYVPAAARPAPMYEVQHSFVGYPEFLAQQLRRRVFNAACPGETTISLLTAAGSNGCEDSATGPTGYRDLYPLHVQYQGTQIDYALKFLHAHDNHTSLITIDAGANDVFLCQRLTPDHCTSPATIGATLLAIRTNLAETYRQLREVAGYQGTIVALGYYSLSYSDPAQVVGTQLLNGAIAAAGAPYGVVMADGFGAFGAASAAAGGNPCAAGLLIPLPGGGCDVHPTALGHQVLAGAIAAALAP